MEELIHSLPAVIKASGDATEVLEAAVFVAWRRAAGAALRTTAVPFRLYRKMLVVSVPDETWRKQLVALSGQLLFKVNSLLGQTVITFIEFRVDPETIDAERKSRPQTQRKEDALALDCALDLSDEAEVINDDDLRRRFLLAAGSYLSAQKIKRQLSTSKR
jgi:hypothetical protein